MRVDAPVEWAADSLTRVASSLAIRSRTRPLAGPPSGPNNALNSLRNAAVRVWQGLGGVNWPLAKSTQEVEVSLRLPLSDQLGFRGLLRLRAFVAGTLLFAAPPAWCSDAEKPSPFQAPWWGPESATVYGGSYGIRGPEKWEDVFTGLEIRGGPFWWELRVITGALAASDGNFFAYAGVLADIPAWNVIHFILSFAPGYSVSGTDHYLGFPLIFRSTAEVSFRMTAQARLGVSFSHMSNGRLAAPNPGVETVSLTLTLFALPY